MSTKQNSLLKFVQGMRLFEWAIVGVLIFFLGLFVWGFTQPKFTPETQPVNPETKVRLYEFWGNGCPHCAKADPFLKKMDRELKELEVYQYEVYYNAENQQKQNKVAAALGKDSGGVPFFVVGDQTFQGFDDENGVGRELRERIDFCIQNACPDKTGEILCFPKLLSTGQEVSKEEEKFATISLSEAKKLLEQKPDDLVVLDARTEVEFKNNKISSEAINLDAKSPDFRQKIESLDKSKTYLVYGQTGTDSKNASRILAEKGFSKVQSLNGGAAQWFSTTQK